MNEPIDSLNFKNNETDGLAPNSLTSEQFDYVIFSVNEMMDRDYEPIEEGALPSRSLSLEVDGETEEFYYIIQYEDDPKVIISIGVPGTNDSNFININPEGLLELEENEPMDGIVQPLNEYTVDLLESISEAYNKQKNRHEIEKRFSEISEPDEFGEPLEVDSSERLRVLDDAEYPDGFEGQNIDKQFILDAGVGPVMKMKITEKLSLYAGKPYINRGRLHVLAFTDHDGQVLPRTYYQSSSQGVWRYQPGKYYSEKGGTAHYKKGLGEQSLDLPSEVQDMLDSLAMSEYLELASEISERLSNGSLSSVFSGHEVMHITGSNPLSPEIAGDIVATPRSFDEQNPLAELSAPEDVEYVPEMKDKYHDFKRILSSNKVFSPHYGDFFKHKVDSVDGEWRYQFAEDSEGRIWLAHAEDLTATINPAGLRTAYPKLGVLFSPAWEYESQAGDYAGKSISNKGYVDVYEKFLSRLQIIKDCTKALAEKQS